MGVDRNSIAELIRRNSDLGDAMQIKKTWFRLGRKSALISLVILSMMNIAPYHDYNTSNRVLVLVVINVYAILMGIGLWLLATHTFKEEITKPPIPQAKPSKLNTIIASMMPMSGVIGMYFGRAFLSNLTQNSALLVFLFVCASLYAFFTFGACKLFHMAYLIWRYDKT